MRIAHIGSKGIPSKGGTERVVEAVAARHARRHHVTVYGSRRVCASASVAGVRVISLPQPQAKHLGPVVLQLLASAHALLCGRYDVVHVHASENGFVVPLLRLRFPVVTTNHGPAYEREKWGELARKLIRANERFSVEAATVATAVAAVQAGQLTHRYGREVVHVPNGVDLSLPPDEEGARRLLAAHGLEEGGYLLFAAARVDPTKGCHTLIEALRGMDDRPPLLVLGDLGHAAGYEERLRSLAADLPVTFAPRIDDRGVVLGLLALCRAFVFPSTVEAMSMMLLEALGVGVVGVASDIPENTSGLPPGYPTFRAGARRGPRLGRLAARGGEGRGARVGARALRLGQDRRPLRGSLRGGAEASSDATLRHVTPRLPAQGRVQVKRPRG